MRKIFLVLAGFLIFSGSFAQKNKKDKREENKKRLNAMIKQEEEGVIVHKKHFVFGGKLISDGYGFFIEKGISKSINKATLIQFEISERKSPKEEKQSNLYAFSTPFIFGKQNSIYPIKLGVQQQVLFGNKSNKNGVSVTYNFGGGVTAALVRPYYVQTKTGSYIKFDSKDSLAFLDPTQITGSAGFKKGWSDMTVNPGAYVKTALRFDYGSYNELVSAIEVGISGEFYSKKVPIMAKLPARQFFFSGYVALLFGRRK